MALLGVRKGGEYVIGGGGQQPARGLLLWPRGARGAGWVGSLGGWQSWRPFASRTAEIKGDSGRPVPWRARQSRGRFLWPGERSGRLPVVRERVVSRGPGCRPERTLAQAAGRAATLPWLCPSSPLWHASGPPVSPLRRSPGRRPSPYVSAASSSSLPPARRHADAFI